MGKESLVSWTHAVIEIFDLNDIGFGISREEMTDRIDEGRYAWCVVEDDIVVHFMPLWKILWIKLKKWASDVHTFVYNNVYYPIYKRTYWGKKAQKEWDEYFEEIEESDEELEELFEDWEAIAEKSERYE